MRVCAFLLLSILFWLPYPLAGQVKIDSYAIGGYFDVDGDFAWLRYLRKRVGFKIGDSGFFTQATFDVGHQTGSYYSSVLYFYSLNPNVAVNIVDPLYFQYIVAPDGTAPDPFYDGLYQLSQGQETYLRMSLAGALGYRMYFLRKFSVEFAFGVALRYFDFTSVSQMGTTFTFHRDHSAVPLLFVNPFYYRAVDVGWNMELGFRFDISQRIFTATSLYTDIGGLFGLAPGGSGNSYRIGMMLGIRLNRQKND